MLKVDNKTDKELFCHLSFDFPDTSINFQGPQIDDGWSIIGPHSKHYGGGGCLEDRFKNFPIQKVSVFLFDADLLRTTPWEKVRQNYQVLKRYDVTLDELISYNYVIEFP